MAVYMTQRMSSGRLPAITYYRRQSPHADHKESGAFTRAAIQAYARHNNIPENEVVPGRYMSGQGVPTGGNTQEI